ncbi:hypothetical protein [Streptomyces yaizuensis]|uniref:Alanine-rich protein n=1 Tax=Streptomyces yaizuensis TaxID=2989713 RepID=A0ABQ5P7U9_9ACTN|nr:hypothetical protein [Streptomyces sp. YSPA8]GLF98650.1 alanine-rich protein [Streptomyces sp. YSPA8]
MRAAAFLYPWDVVGDPGAATRTAALGVQQVTLAAAYHSTRALTPRHPRHRIVTAAHSAVLYPPDPARWAGRTLRPYPAGQWASGDAFGAAAEALTAAGLDVHTWVVLAHNSRLGTEHPGSCVVNAYGDRYPWAPCVARPEVRSYLTALAAEAATRPGARGTELESCGWYGLAHLHAHDKIAGVGMGDAERYLMSLCFCDICGDGYARHGTDPDRFAHTVRTALAPLWAGTAPAGAGIERLIGAEPTAATLDFRTRVARTLQEDVVAAVRAAAPVGFRVLLHAHPVAYHCGADAGVDPAHILSVADGVVVPCTGGAQALRPFADRAAVTGTDPVLAANLTVVRGMGGRPDRLAEDARAAAGVGATELRLYHAGLAADGDLCAVRVALSGLS